MKFMLLLTCENIQIVSHASFALQVQRDENAFSLLQPFRRRIICEPELFHILLVFFA